MSEFDIKLRQTQLSIIEMWNNEAQLSQMRDDIDSVSRNLGFRMAGNPNIVRRLNSIGNAVDGQRHNMGSLRNALTGASDLYRATESKICVITSVRNFITETKVAVTGPCLSVTDLVDSFWDKDDKGSLEKRANDELQRRGLRDEYTLENGKWKKNDPDEKKTDKKDDKVELDKVATFVNLEASASGEFYELEGKKEYEHGYVEGSVEIGTAEAHGGLYGGLYSVGPDGKKRVTLGVGGEFGIGISALTVAGQAVLGDDNYGGYVKGEASVLSAELKGGFDVGFTDETGKINPQVQVNASMEALLGEAEVTGGVKVAGVDVNGSAGINIGVGAHADVGLKDGKFKCDIGASLGIGVSVKFEVDAGQLVENVGNAVSSVASSAWDSLTDWIKW